MKHVNLSLLYVARYILCVSTMPFYYAYFITDISVLLGRFLIQVMCNSLFKHKSSYVGATAPPAESNRYNNKVDYKYGLIFIQNVPNIKA